MGLTRLAPTVSLTPRERREARRKVKSRDLSSTLQPGLTRLTSTVSLPPRERREARRKAKALKDGLPPTATATKANKGGKLPLPTAASTRPRRSTEYAYIETEGGYEVRRVVRRKFTPEVDAGVPYLPGQDGRLMLSYLWQYKNTQSCFRHSALRRRVRWNQLH